MVGKVIGADDLDEPDSRSFEQDGIFDLPRAHDREIMEDVGVVEEGQIASTDKCGTVETETDSDEIEIMLDEREKAMEELRSGGPLGRLFPIVSKTDSHDSVLHRQRLASV
eukprot:GHVP01070925.1.p1 GENE.GHVP01070925.1~~GHVP01070925.1.p1  ORF type:complete len:111 (+),score=23.68 GHVP01070925.1:764-1096(+)